MHWHDGSQATNALDQRFLTQETPGSSKLPLWLRAQWQTLSDTLQRWKGESIRAELTFTSPLRAYHCLSVVKALDWYLTQADVFTFAPAFVISAHPLGAKHVITFRRGQEDKLVISSQTEGAFDWGRQEHDVMSAIRRLEMILGPVKQASGLPG